MNYLILIWGVLNLISFAAFGLDKMYAIQNHWRIPEIHLIVLSAAGIFGGLLGMVMFRHKIRKPKFTIGLPVIAMLEVFLTALATGRLS
jgi:uncharacterized membrane protein YsdA (DUF1294 family)